MINIYYIEWSTSDIDKIMRYKNFISYDCLNKIIRYIYPYNKMIFLIMC